MCVLTVQHKTSDLALLLSIPAAKNAEKYAVCPAVMHWDFFVLTTLLAKARWKFEWRTQKLRMPKLIFRRGGQRHQMQSCSKQLQGMKELRQKTETVLYTVSQ